MPAEALATPADASTRTRHGTRRPHGLSMVVLVIGLVVTAGLVTASRINYQNNERRQVLTRTQLAADALAVAPVDVQRRLGRATTLASATGDMSLYAGAIRGSLPTPFHSVRLFRMDHGTPRLVYSLGAATLLDPSSSQAHALLTGPRLSQLGLTRVVTPSAQALGYAFAVKTRGRTYVSYAEQMLPANRRMAIQAGSPLADMDYAIYYGPTAEASALLLSNTDDLPIGGTVGRVPVTFGDHVLTLVMAPRRSLLGQFAAAMPWLIALAGLVLTALMVLLVERLARRRAVAEQLAAVTDELYRTQRGVAETLQTALLPHALPTSARLAIATRYLAGTAGIEVGGDWYDVIDLPGDRVFFTIGDVSGRGLTAATMMSRLRHSIAAYALEGNDPAMVLVKVSGLIDLKRDAHFATALCGVLDLTSGRVAVANAGHPPLVVVGADAATPLAAPVGPPLGVGSDYRLIEASLAPGSVLLAYTDGLVERRDEAIDDRIQRLCHTARATTGLEHLLDTVLSTMVPPGASEDDTAILGLQWTP